jgi:hypothetical protein
MNEQIVTIETMQADHRTWLAAHAQWRKDIERWQAEHRSAVSRLVELQNFVGEHGQALDAHAQAFQQAENAIAAHEREIVKQRKGANEKPQDIVANRHQQQEGAYDRQQDAHERIRKHHDAVMAQLQSLESAAAAAM